MKRFRRYLRLRVRNRLFGSWIQSGLIRQSRLRRQIDLSHIANIVFLNNIPIRSRRSKISTDERLVIVCSLQKLRSWDSFVLHIHGRWILSHLIYSSRIHFVWISLVGHVVPTHFLPVILLILTFIAPIERTFSLLISHKHTIWNVLRILRIADTVPSILDSFILLYWSSSPSFPKRIVLYLLHFFCKKLLLAFPGAFDLIRADDGCFGGWRRLIGRVDLRGHILLLRSKLPFLCFFSILPLLDLSRYRHTCWRRSYPYSCLLIILKIKW